MGSHHQPPQTQEIPAVKELMKEYLKSVPPNGETPIYDELMESYVRYYGWDKDNPFGVVWSVINHPAVVDSVNASHGPAESPPDSDESSDGSGDPGTREFAVVLAERVSVADADAIAESLMHDLPAARVSTPVPPHPSSKSLPPPFVDPAAGRTRGSDRVVESA